MPQSKWVSLSTDRLLPDGIEQIPGVLQGITHAVDTALSAAADAAEALDGLVGVIDSPEVLAVRAAVASMNASMGAGLWRPAKLSMHCLPVPILRTDANPLMPIIPSGVVIDGPMSIAGSGGNPGFYNTVQRSLYDTDDMNRPLFPPTSYVSGAVLMVGAEAFSGMVDALQFLRRLGGALATGLDSHVVPYPVGVSARPIPYPNDNGLAVELQWLPQPPVGKAEYGIAGFLIRNVVVYRSKFPISGIMSPEDLSELEISRMLYDPLQPRFVDTDVTTDDVFYYAIGYEIDVADLTGSFKQLREAAVSSYVRVDLTTGISPTGGYIPMMYATTGRGTPPDWMQLAYVFEMIPAVNQAMQQLSNYITLMEQSLAQSSSSLATAAANLRTIVSSRLAIINRVVTLLNDMLQLLVPNTGVYAFAFSGAGGNDYMLKALYNALFDTSDPNRPPFDTGAELVAGLVFVAGAGSLTELWPVEMFTGALVGAS